MCRPATRITSQTFTLHWKTRTAQYERTLARENNSVQLTAAVVTVASRWYESGPVTPEPASRKGQSAVVKSEYCPDKKSRVPAFILFGIHIVSNRPRLSAKEGASWWNRNQPFGETRVWDRRHLQVCPVNRGLQRTSRFIELGFFLLLHKTVQTLHK